MKLFDRTMALVMVYAVLFPVIVTLAVNRTHWGDFLEWLTGEGGSGWFQAIGSVATLLFSGLFVARQIQAGWELERERRRADFHSQRNRALRAVVYHAQTGASVCRSIASILERDGYSPTRIKACLAQLNLNHDALWKIDPSVIPDELTGIIFKCNLDISLAIMWSEVTLSDKSHLGEFIEQMQNVSFSLNDSINKIIAHGEK